MNIDLITGISLGVIATLLGVLLGQHSVWMFLRRKKRVRIGDWEYAATEVFESEGDER